MVLFAGEQVREFDPFAEEWVGKKGNKEQEIEDEDMETKTI